MQEVIEGIIAALKGGTALMALASGGVWLGLAPGTATYPFVTVAEYGPGADIPFMEGGWHDASYVVKMIDEGRSAVDALAGQALIDQALTTAAVAISGHKTLRVRRRTFTAYPEVDGDITYWHAGGVYQVTFI